ncbi:hypothetical protein Tco_1515862 [Tanacetum coccineum]
MNTMVAHSQAYALVERANKSLMHALKARLGRDRASWVDELPNHLKQRYEIQLTRPNIRNEGKFAAIQESKYKKKVEQYYDKGIGPWLSNSKTLSAAGMKQVEWGTKARWALTG